MSVRIPVVGTPISEGEVELKSEDWNDSHSFHLDFSSEILKGEIKNTIRQLQDRSIDFSGDGDDVWAEAYVDSSGRMDSVIGSTSTFNTNKYQHQKTDDEPFVIFEASDVSGSWNINNCDLSKLFENYWFLRCLSGDFETRRARIMKTLFYGTNGSNPRAVSANFTDLTNIYTNVERDVGKQAHYLFLKSRAETRSFSGESNNVDVSYEMTFNDTSDNKDFSYWNRMKLESGGTTGETGSNTLQIPTGNTIKSESSSGGTDIDDNDIGQDNSSSELDNPQTFFIRTNASSNGNWTTDIQSFNIILTKPTVSVSFSDNSTINDSNSFEIGNEHIDFMGDESIPTFSSLSSELINLTNNITNHNLPSIFQKPTTKSLGTVLYDDWEEGNSVEYKFIDSSDNETGWLSEGEFNSFSEITPEKVIVKLNPKEIDPTTGFPSIKGFGFKAWND